MLRRGLSVSDAALIVASELSKKGWKTPNLHDDQLHALEWEGGLNNDAQNSEETIQAYIAGLQTCASNSTWIFPVLLDLLVIVESAKWRCTYPESNAVMVRASS